MDNTDDFKLPDYSVIMSVYEKEKAQFLKESIESMLEQTFVTNDFILVCDGQLSDELNEVVEYFEKKYVFFHPLRLEENIGTGGCANEGIKLCKNDYIVKMDSDDISLPNRCEISMKFLAAHPEIDMVGAYIEEFDSTTGESIAVKKTPLSYKEIKKYSKRRNPFNNQTLAYRKSAAQKCGGYSKLSRCEDYDFVVKMLAGGARGRNIPQVLVKYRVTPENLQRRRNFANTKAFISVRWKILKTGYSSFLDFLIPCLAQLVLFILPGKITGKLYKKFLRK